MAASDHAKRRRNGAVSPRKWGNRRPPGKRIDLTPEQIAAKEAEREESKQLAFIGFRLTKEEKAEIERRAKATGNRLSDFARIVLLSDLKEPAPPAHDPEALRKLAFEISKVGTNINQLAKIANESRRIQTEGELRALSAQIVAALEKVIAL